MNEELLAAEELSKWMRCQRSRRRQHCTNELVTPPGTPRTIHVSQAIQQGRGPGSAPLSPHSILKKVAWMEPWSAEPVAAAPGVASALASPSAARVSRTPVPRFAPDDSESMSFEPVLDLGMRVRARFLASEPKEVRRKKAGANKWRGTIVAVGAGGVTYDVEYDDKVIEQGVHARFVQRLDDEEPEKEPIKEPEWPGRGARSGRDVEPMERAKVHKYDLAASSMEQLPDFGLQHERNSKIEPR